MWIYVSVWGRVYNKCTHPLPSCKQKPVPPCWCLAGHWFFFFSFSLWFQLKSLTQSRWTCSAIITQAAAAAAALLTPELLQVQYLIPDWWAGVRRSWWGDVSKALIGKQTDGGVWKLKIITGFGEAWHYYLNRCRWLIFNKLFIYSAREIWGHTQLISLAQRLSCPFCTA